MEHHTLPHGARGIEGDDFAIQFGNDKIVLPRKSDGEGNHYTFHAGFDSGVIDVHETLIDASGQKTHRTLFAIRKDVLPEVFNELISMPVELLRLFRPLRLGWLKHHGIGIARGIDPVNDDEIAAVTRKHHRRLIVDEQRWKANVFVPEYLEEVWDFPDGMFSLFDRGRKIGIGFKKTESDGNVRLFWIKLRHLERFGIAWKTKVMDALFRSEIPPENYGDYLFLRP